MRECSRKLLHIQGAPQAAVCDGRIEPVAADLHLDVSDVVVPFAVQGWQVEVRSLVFGRPEETYLTVKEGWDGEAAFMVEDA